MLTGAIRMLSRGTIANSSAARGARYFSSVKFLEQKRSGEETVYFKKEDEALLRRLLVKHPEADPRFQHALGDESLESLQSALALCLNKHLKAQAPKALLEELIVVFVNNGWAPPPDQKKVLQGKKSS